MSESASPDANAIEAAARRLIAALDGLEAAVEQRRELDGNDELLAIRIHALGVDRSRLAHELDQLTARSRTLERTNREIAQRLDQAIATIRAVLESDGP